MRPGRPPLELGAHGKITTRTVASGHVFALARMRLWDGDILRVTATARTASDARVLLKLRMAERVRLSELDAWRYLTQEDPFDELVYVWLNDLGWLSDASEAACELCQRIVRTQLTEVVLASCRTFLFLQDPSTSSRMSIVIGSTSTAETT